MRVESKIKRAFFNAGKIKAGGILAAFEQSEKNNLDQFLRRAGAGLWRGHRFRVAWRAGNIHFAEIISEQSTGRRQYRCRDHKNRQSKIGFAIAISASNHLKDFYTSFSCMKQWGIADNNNTNAMIHQVRCGTNCRYKAF